MLDLVSSSSKSSALEAMTNEDPTTLSQPESSALRLLNSFLYDCGRTFVQHCPTTDTSKVRP